MREKQTFKEKCEVGKRISARLDFLTFILIFRKSRIDWIVNDSIDSLELVWILIK